MRVGIITNTGGPSVIATDVLVAAGLTIPGLSENSTAVLKEKLLREVAVHNPLDILATANADHFRAALDAMMGDDGIDSIFISMVTPFFVDNEAIAGQIVEVNAQKRKPIVCTLMTDKVGCAETVRILKEGGVPCYDFPTAAAKVLSALSAYGEISRRITGRVRVFDDVDRHRAKAIMEKAGEAGRKRLSAPEVFEILSSYGLSVAEWRIAANAREAGQAATEIGFPVVVKVDSAHILHKSDGGGVVLNLGDRKAVETAVARLAATHQVPDLHFVVQKYLPGGKEVIVGAKAEGEAGHLIMAGAGGVFVEIMNDVAFRLSPVTDMEARKMLSDLKAAPLFAGARGREGIDIRRLVEVIQRVSQLVYEVPAIREIDLNPIVAFHDSLFVVDGRISV